MPFSNTEWTHQTSNAISNTEWTHQTSNAISNTEWTHQTSNAIFKHWIFGSNIECILSSSSGTYAHMVFVHYFCSGRTLHLAPLLMHMAIIIRQQRTVEHHNSLPGEATVDNGKSAHPKIYLTQSDCSASQIANIFLSFELLEPNWDHRSLHTFSCSLSVLSPRIQCCLSTSLGHTTSLC